MGLPVRIRVYSPTEERAVAAVFARVAELDGMMSDYRPDSELRRLGETAPAVSPDLFAGLDLRRALLARDRSANGHRPDESRYRARDCRRRGHGGRARDGVDRDQSRQSSRDPFAGASRRGVRRRFHPSPLTFVIDDGIVVGRA